MALSTSVAESLLEAESHLRSALASSARNERPFVCLAISKMIGECESLGRTDTLFDTLEDMQRKQENEG